MYYLWKVRGGLPIWPSLHLGCATTLPPIQKNSSASLEMDAFCQSLGELMMEWVGEFTGLEVRLASWAERLASEGEKIPDDTDPIDWKVVLLEEREDCGGLPLWPKDGGAIAEGLLFISEQYIWFRLSCPIRRTWTYLPPVSIGKF